MAKRQTRRSISVSRSTYERLRAYCETNGISMSQFVETRVGDFLGRSIRRPGAPNFTGPIGPSDDRVSEVAPPMTAPPMTAPPMTAPRPPVVVSSAPAPAPVVSTAPVVNAAPPPVARPAAPRQAQPAPPPTKLTPDQIFTF
jgi:hypothetical protein